MTLTVTRFAIRALHELLPDDYDYPIFDIIAHCSDGKIRHCDAVFDTRDEAEIYLAGWELTGYVEDEGELEQWEVTTVSEGE